MIGDINNITNVYGGNKGGVHYFLFVPKEWLRVTGDAPATGYSLGVYINPAAECVVLEPVLIDGKSWLRADCQFEHTGYEEADQEDDRGMHVNVTLSGVVLKDTLESNINIRSLRTYEYVAIYYDYNSVARIIGNQEKGLTLHSNFNTTEAIKDGTRYVLSFTGSFTNHAPIYNKDGITVATNGSNINSGGVAGRAI